MKIIKTDDYDRETVADELVAENIKKKEWAIEMARQLNRIDRTLDFRFLVVEDDYVLKTGDPNR